MTSNEIRQSFLDFFKSKDHRILDIFPVIPHNDPTLLFINAGMNQFKDVFLGTGSRDYKRAANTQKCIRVSGKHNDLEEVGVDTYHHTLFEMLGNWSFGDYYKKEAIDWAWELLTKVWKLDPTRLYATVYRTDDEAFEIWRKYLPDDHIQRFDEKDNFWEMGPTGPCGPCSEVHYDRTPDKSGVKLVNAGSPEVIEIWNLVFIQFNRKENGELEPLADKFVDTGMGFERICSILQGVKSNYDTDIFMPILKEIENLSKIKYGASLESKTDIAMRVIADHLRALAFAISDGTLPGNEGRNYVLRRILRRALRYARELGFNTPVIYKLVPVLVETMGDYFKELKQNQSIIERVILNEEENFLQTMERGLDRIGEIINNNSTSNSNKTISGSEAFLLYDTFGFPLDLTELIAREHGMTVDIAGFDLKMQEQKERSRSARKQINQEISLPNINTPTEFIGYDVDSIKNNSISAKVLFIQENLIVLDKTPFYTESGGQISDRGTITLNNNIYNIIELRKNANTVFHVCDRNIQFDSTTQSLEKLTAQLNIDYSFRKKIAINHTATHILHEALRKVLGEHLQQAGSLVTSNYLRFDFNHFEKLTNEQLEKVEDTVNSVILDQFDITTEYLELEEAKKNSKIKMFFGDKYGDIVRVVNVGEFSSELCGGTHIKNTSEIGIFKIISESSIAAGVRRIEAVTSKEVLNYIKELETKIEEKNVHIHALGDKIKNLEKEINRTKLETLSNSTAELTSDFILIGDIKIISKQLELENIDQLRVAAEKIRESFNTNGICLVASVIENKVQLACAVTDDLKSKAPAGKLVGEAAKILGGGGGGKPHLATAGGKDTSKLDYLLKTEFYNILRNIL